MHTAPVRRSLGRGLTNQGRNDDPQGPVAERDVERERDSLARRLSYLFSWREMLSYLRYLTVPYRRYCPKPTRSQDIERHDAFWLMQQVEHHRHSRVPRRASMTCTCPATPPPRATASSDYDAPSCFQVPPTTEQQQAPAPFHACLPSDDRSGEDCQEATSTCTLPARFPFHPSIVIWNKAWRG